VEYKTDSARKQAILVHLQAADPGFAPPLSSRVRLEDYAEKLAENADTFEAWDGATLAGLIACYLNDGERAQGYISHVAVLEGLRGRGVAARLLAMCLERARQAGFKTVGLEVDTSNTAARALYERAGFAATQRTGTSTMMAIHLDDAGPGPGPAERRGSGSS